MGRVTAPAQVQQTKTTSISKQESVQLTHHLLRVAIYHLGYLRGFFPESQYHGVDRPNLDGMHTKTLRPDTPESQKLIAWVEKGLPEALQLSYLRDVYYGISRDCEGQQLLEEYIFSFTYTANGVSMDMVAPDINGKAKRKAIKAKAVKGKPGQGVNVDQVRYQVVRLMRVLCQVCQTLDQIPDECFQFMKLTYYDHTPDGYQPPGFIAAKNDGIGHFSRRPFTMPIGTVGTGHHCVGLKVKSVLDNCSMEEEDGEEEQNQVADNGVADSANVSSMDGSEAQAEDDDGAANSREGGDDVDGRIQNQDVVQTVHHSSPDGEAAPSMVGPRHDDAATSGKAQPARAAKASSLKAHETHGAKSTVAEPVNHAEAMSEDETEVPADDDMSPAQQKNWDKVKAFCQRHSQVDFTDVLAQFMDVSPAMLETWFGKLQQEGILQPLVGSSGCYHVLPQASGPPAKAVSAPPPSHCPDDKHDAVMQQLQSMCVDEAAASPAGDGSGQLEGTSARRPAHNAAATGQRQGGQPGRTRSASGTEQGGVHEGAAGADGSPSVAPGAAGAVAGGMRGQPGAGMASKAKGALGRTAAEAAGAAMEVAAMGGIHIDASQHSEMVAGKSGRARKASFVAEPIDQRRAKRARPAAPAASPAPTVTPPAAPASSARAPRGSRLQAMKG